VDRRQLKRKAIAKEQSQASLIKVIAQPKAGVKTKKEPIMEESDE
jgi:hypothetical protein